jgi:hypothetical protein
MKKTQGKFVLYDIAEFADWLSSTTISRIVKLVQNHHTFIPSYSNFTGNNHFNLLRAMENAHLERGCGDRRARHVSDGTVAVCRSLERPGGHIRRQYRWYLY